MNRGYNKRQQGRNHSDFKRESSAPDHHMSKNHRNSHGRQQAKRQRRDGRWNERSGNNVRLKSEPRQHYNSRPVKSEPRQYNHNWPVESEPNSQSIKIEQKGEPKVEAEVLPLPTKKKEAKAEVIILDADDGEATVTHGLDDSTPSEVNNNILSSANDSALQEEVDRMKEEIKRLKEELDRGSAEEENSKEARSKEENNKVEKAKTALVRKTNRLKEEVATIRLNLKEEEIISDEQLKLMEELKEECEGLKVGLKTVQQAHQESEIAHSDLQTRFTELQGKNIELDRKLYQRNQDLKNAQDARNAAEGNLHSVRVQSARERDQRLVHVKQENTSTSDKVAAYKRKNKILRDFIQEHQRIEQLHKDYPNADEATIKAMAKEPAKVKVEQ